MYISAEWLGPLEDALLKAERKHSGSFSMLSDIFNDPHELVRCCIEPHCRYQDYFDNAGMAEDMELPVEQVSWNDDQYFCEELTRLLPEGLGVPLEFRLPKESEWVHACRVGNSTNYSYGDNERDFGQHGWYSGNSDGTTHKLGGKRPNPWGFHDRHGNVWEWCYDRDDDFAHRLINDLMGEEKQEVRAIRGGGWSSLVYACRIANRNMYLIYEYRNCIGFRVALVQKGSGIEKES